MEGNVCDINHLDADGLLPPRKRLLAGLKKQSSDGGLLMPLSSSVLSEFDVKLSNMLKSHLNSTPEEIVKASRSAAEAAVKIAKAARVVAEEKAVAASKAMADAKSALDLVATVAEDIDSKDKYSRRNKMKRQDPVQMLYHKKQKVDTDEEVARNLHRVINSSPRTIKNSPNSDSKSNKYKRVVKSLVSLAKANFPNGDSVQEGNVPPLSNGFGSIGELDSEDSTLEVHVVRFDESTSNLDKIQLFKMETREVVTSESKGKMREAVEDPFTGGRKKGRMKQKKLPLSICNIRDQTNPKEEVKYRSFSLAEGYVSNDTTGNKPLFSKGPSDTSVMPIERPSTWKCKAFKAGTCVKRNKVMQL